MAPSRPIALPVTAAAGMASAYHAPLAGSLFIAEILFGTLMLASLGPCGVKRRANSEAASAASRIMAPSRPIALPVTTTSDYMEALETGDGCFDTPASLVKSLASLLVVVTGRRWPSRRRRRRRPTASILPAA
jgi:H+/Cl- antiporter ClcA